MRDFLTGISTIPSALRLLGAPGLRAFVWLPILINAVVFVGLFVLGYAWIQAVLAGWLPDPAAIHTDSWLGWLYYAFVQLAFWVLLPLYLMASAVIAFFSFTAVANLIAAPFNGMLSARVESRLTGSMPEAIQARGVVVEVGGAIADEGRKLAYFALWIVPLLILTLIPGLNLLAGPLWLAAGVWMIALEYMDYPLGNRGMAFNEQRRWLRGRIARHSGLGAGILALTLIPGLNLVAMPTGVIAATLLHTRNAPVTDVAPDNP
jgi:CysZ protein